MAVTQYLFWTEYTLFDDKNGSFNGDEFICKSKDIRYCNSHFGIKNIHFLVPSCIE